MRLLAVEFPCGRLPPPESGPEQTVVGQTRLVGANHCPKGECPWQVSTAALRVEGAEGGRSP